MHHFISILAQDQLPVNPSAWIAPGSVGGALFLLIGYLLKITIPKLMEQSQAAMAGHLDTLHKNADASRMLFAEQMREMRQENAKDRERFAQALDRLSGSINHLEQRMATLDGNTTKQGT